MPYAKVQRSDRKIVEVMPQRKELQQQEKQQYDIVEVDESAQVGETAQPKGQQGQGQQGHPGGGS